jgi:hypothetical protein
VTAQTDIQGILQLLHEPADKNKYHEFSEVAAFYRVLLYVLVL